MVCKRLDMSIRQGENHLSRSRPGRFSSSPAQTRQECFWYARTYTQTFCTGAPSLQRSQCAASA